MSEKDHKKHNHYHFGFFLVAAVALCFVFAFSGERAADAAAGDARSSRAFEFAGTVAHFIAVHWWIVPLALLPFWVLHFMYSEWRFLKHIYHVVLLGAGIGFLLVYFQLDRQMLSFLP